MADEQPLKSTGTGRPYMNSAQFAQAPQYQQAVQQKQYEQIEAEQGRIAPPAWAQKLHSQTNAWLARAGTGAKRAEGVYTSPKLQLGPLKSTKPKDAKYKEVDSITDEGWAQKIGTTPQQGPPVYSLNQPVRYGATRMSEQAPPGAGEWVKGSAQNAKTTEYTPGSGQYLAPKDRFIGPPSPMGRPLMGGQMDTRKVSSTPVMGPASAWPGGSSQIKDPFIGPPSPMPRKLK